MLKLMNLELTRVKKKKLLGIFIEILIIAIAIGSLLYLTYNMNDMFAMIEQASPAEKIELMADMAEMQADFDEGGVITILLAIPFLIYSAINYSRFVVKDYEKGWLKEIFTYPISRKKMMFSKILLALLISSLGMLLASVLVIAVMSQISSIIFTSIIIKQVLITAILTPFIALIPLLIGVWRKSSIATIITSVVMTLVLQSNTGSFSLQSFPIINYSLALIGIVGTILYFAKINGYDFVK